MPQTIVDYCFLKDWCLKVLAKVGLPDNEAEILVDSLVKANLRGIDTHGVNHLPIYIKRMKMGLIAVDGKIKIVSEGPSFALIDAGNKLGQIASHKAMHLAIKKANNTGIGLVGVKNSNNCGTLAYFTMMALESDFIGIGCTNSPPVVAPWGSTNPFLGTNPLSIVVPAGEEYPLVLDMATSAAARAKIVMAASKGEKIPFEWAIDVDGAPTDDPHKALKGAVLPLGGYKGFGLSMMVNILSGILTGSASGNEVGGFLFSDGVKKQNEGHLFQAVRIERFVPLEEFKERIDRMIRQIRSSPRSPGVERIFMPGEIELEEERKRSQEGIPLNDYVIKELKKLGKEYSIEWDF